MVVYHTSPELIEEIKTGELFGDNLFFSSEVYYMTQAEKPVIYEMELDEEKVVEVGALHDEEIIERIADVMSVDEDDAERLLDGRDTAFDHGGNGEDDWWIQRMQGECAAKMGYDACESFDEQGTVYIVPMGGKLERLKLSEAA